MNITKKLICTLIAGTTLLAAAPVFADSFRDRGYEHHRHAARFHDYDRRGYRDFDRRHVVVVQRPYIVEQPVYYSQPAPLQNVGMGAMIGAVIGGIYDSRQ